MYQKNDSIYQSLKNEYVTGTSSYEALINHYESLVKQLTAENDLIKQVLKVWKFIIAILKNFFLISKFSITFFF